MQLDASRCILPFLQLGQSNNYIGMHTAAFGGLQMLLRAQEQGSRALGLS